MGDRRVEFSKIIAHPVAAVFSAASDPMNQLAWDTATTRSMVKVSDGPLAQGSRFRAQMKGFGAVDLRVPDLRT